MTLLRQISYEDSPNLDAFGRLRISNPLTLFDSTLIEGSTYDPNWETYLTAAATFTLDPATASGLLDTTNSGDEVIRIQHGYNHYIPGKSMLVAMTGLFGLAQADVVKQIGYGDDKNALYFEQDGTNGNNIILRTDVSGAPLDNSIAQADWNLDTLDGSEDEKNPSGILLNTNSVNVFIIDFQWLGGGRVRFGYDIGGIIIYVHHFLNANFATLPYLRTGSLPVAFRMKQNNATAGTMRQVSAVVISEGGFDRFGSIIAQSTGVATKSIGNGLRHSAISVRMKQFLDVTLEDNRRIAVPINVALDVNQDSFIELIIQHSAVATPVFGGSPSWNNDGPNTGVEWTSGITTVTGGHRISGQFIKSTNQAGVQGLLSDIFSVQFTPINFLLLSRKQDLSESDIIHLMVTPIGNSVTRGTISLREVF